MGISTKKTITLGTECFLQNNIVEYRPSNLENAYVFYKNTLKQFTDSKHENVLTRTPFSINLKDALGVHQFGKNKT